MLRTKIYGLRRKGEWGRVADGALNVPLAFAVFRPVLSD